MPTHFIYGRFGLIECDYRSRDHSLPQYFGHWHPHPQHWHDVRAQAFARDKWRCTACNSKRNLEGNHRTYERWGKELVSDVYTLCTKCHAQLHDAPRRGAA